MEVGAQQRASTELFLLSLRSSSKIKCTRLHAFFSFALKSWHRMIEGLSFININHIALFIKPSWSFRNHCKDWTERNLRTEENYAT
jgi:hypothetical protein